MLVQGSGREQREAWVVWGKGKSRLLSCPTGPFSGPILKHSSYIIIATFVAYLAFKIN